MYEENVELVKKKKISTTRLIVMSFFAAIVVGTILLCLPISSVDGKWTPIVDALFTATTSVCVTGLVVVDTYAYWSLFGKIIILFLIQLGGLGIISFTTLFFIAIGKRVTMKDRLLIMDAFNLNSISGLVKFLLRIIKGTILIESLGAIGYSFVFIPRYGYIKGIAFSIFHAVSAFCNAGIDILGNRSLADYVLNPWMNIVTIFLIVFGGIGFIVWWDIVRVIRLIRKKEIFWSDFWTRLSLHTKIVLTMTTILIFGGALLFLILEFNNPKTIGSFTFLQKIMACLFQSVTTRTAGFFMISQKGLTDASAFLCMLLMFIGGSPVGTAGGVKTTTIAVAFIEAWSMVKGRESGVVFHRTIPVHTMRKGIMVVCISVFCLITATILLSAINGGDFVDVAFETASALGTAGLSRDFTGTLKLAGKLIIIVCMYLGRVGPVSMAIAFKLNSDKMVGRYKEEDITIG